MDPALRIRECLVSKEICIASVNNTVGKQIECAATKQSNSRQARLSTADRMCLLQEDRLLKLV